MPRNRAQIVSERPAVKLRETGRSGVQRACEDILAAERIMCLRMNAGDTYGTYKGKTWRKRGHEKGTADLLAAPVAYTLTWDVSERVPLWLWIECKSTDGKQTDDQKEFQRKVEALGHHYIVVNDPDQLTEYLRQIL